VSEEHISIPEERGQRCSISISDHGIDLYFHPNLPSEPHKPTRTEIMAAAALVGIARALTGKGAEQVIHALAQFERETARKKL
jgi:hypothetical protein